MTPLRRVVGGADWPRRVNCIGNNQLQCTYWDLELECGHRVERRVRYPKAAGRVARGFAALHHPRDRKDAIPAPKRIRCPHCAVTP